MIALRQILQRALSDRPVLICGLVSLVVLLPGADWGIPSASSPAVIRGWEVDGIAGISVLAELHNLTVAAKPDWYVAYPLFHYLVLTVVYAPYLAFAVLTGRLQAPSSEYPYGFADPIASVAVLTALGHAVSIMMGCGVIMAVFVLARRMFGTRLAPLAAALALLNAPFLFYSRTGNLDVPVLFWLLLCLVVVERSWTEGLTTRRAVACGVLAALAVATKDQAYGLLILPLAALIVRSIIRAGPEGGAAKYRPAVLLLGAGALAYVIAGGIVIRPDRFVRHLEYITNFREEFANVRFENTLTLMRPRTIAGFGALLGDVLRATAAAAGWPVVIVGIAGLLVPSTSRRRTTWITLALVGFMLLVIVPIQHMQYRYAIAPGLLLAISAAGVVRHLERSRLLTIAMSLLLIAGGGIGAVELTHAMVVDARRGASEWFANHAGKGDSVGFYGRPHQVPLLPAGVQAIALTATDTGATLERVRPRWVVVAPDYFADVDRERSTFLPESLYNRLRDGSLGWTRVAWFRSPGLLPRQLPFLPYVNPAVQVYQRREQPAAGIAAR